MVEIPPLGAGATGRADFNTGFLIFGIIFPFLGPFFALLAATADAGSSDEP